MTKKAENEEEMIGANAFEKFTTEVMNRKDFNGADYNPRKISDSKKKKLKAILKKHGMVTPITINKRTGNIVGGHQRVGILDSLIRKNDYEITVSVIDVDLAEEKKLNVILNNQGITGEWDLDLLESMKEESPELDFVEDLGFDQIEIEEKFFDSDLFFPPEKAEESGYMSTDFEAGDTSGNIAPGEEVVVSNSYESPDDQDATAELDNLQNFDSIKEAKKAARQAAKLENSEGNSHLDNHDDKIVTIVFANDQEKWDFMKSINKKVEETHLKPSFLYDIQKKELDVKNSKKENRDNKVFICFDSNSYKKEFMQNMRKGSDSKLLSKDDLCDLQDGKLNIM